MANRSSSTINAVFSLHSSTVHNFDKQMTMAGKEDLFLSLGLPIAFSQMRFFGRGRVN